MNVKNITRFRTEYNAIEDRIRLISELGENPEDTVTILLTQRLLIRLVPSLSRALNAPKYTASTDPVSLHQFAQSAASNVISTKTETPVTASIDSPTVLPDSLELAPSAKALTILLASSANTEHKYSLAMPALHLRQWLTILHQLFTNAEWPIDAFPEWITTNGATSTQASMAVH